MKLPPVIEINFDGYVKKPDNRHSTNVLRVKGSSSNGSADVDTLDMDVLGVIATKTVGGKKYTSLYPWVLITDVKLETEILDADAAPLALDDAALESSIPPPPAVPAKKKPGRPPGKKKPEDFRMNADED